MTHSAALGPLDPTLCPKTPDAIRDALQARPEWLSGFTADFMSAAGAFSQEDIDAALNRWHPYAVACRTPGYLEEVDAIMRRVNAGETSDMVFYDETGHAYDIENNRLPTFDRTV
ncbi:DUF6247 family protein [Streptomyces sp. NPDC054784]